ncbi:hypothetical protein BBC27_02700 [Acidithiobacillus ferrivorans]|uniref:O-antigen ligase-related domain-containing protein n=1 Tax=Acidithiobacillus ferrivorans TaxID=160808 RepID=A0A1B9BVP3_9PROT|nr:O-antigen ligase family protein [Acidithiobacillus ferrivorans]OCB01766.1 hypothetical protein BBC27_02700 [Acidithiobacillus ferrivorans]
MELNYGKNFQDMVVTKLSREDILVVLLGLQMFWAFYTIAFSSISGGIFFAYFIFSGKWKDLDALRSKSWFWLALAIMYWAPTTLLWSIDKVSGSNELRSLWFYGLLLCGATIRWTDRRLRIILMMFVVGAMTNLIVAIMEYIDIWPLTAYDPRQGLVGYSYRVFLGVDTVPLILFMLYDIKNKFLFSRSLYPAIIGTLLVFQIALTQGRTGQAILAILLIPFLYLVFEKYRKVLVLSVVGVFIIGAVSVVFSPFIQVRWLHVVKDIYEFYNGHPDTDVGLRFVFWDAAFHMAESHILFGVGPGSFWDYTVRFIKAGVVPHISPVTWGQIEPHNSFLAYLTSYGLIGLSLFVGLIVVLWRRAWESRLRPASYFQLAMISSFVIGSFSDVMIFRFACVAPFMVAMAINDVKC